MHRDRVKSKLTAILSDYRYLLVMFVLAGIVASIQPLLSGTSIHDKIGLPYNHYNNYSIFKYSFFHLIDYKDLYIMHIDDHFDLYKYSPTFSVFFGLFAFLPDWLGLNLWNITSAVALFASIHYLPKFNNYQKGLILVIILIELITSLQNAQSNALIAALFIFAFGLLERKNYALATLCIVSTVFIKIFGIVAFVLILFYPRKWKFILYSLIWSALLFLLPLIFIDVDQYILLGYSYLEMLSEDHTESYGFSVLGWLYTWFGILVNKYLIVLIGAIIFMVPMIRINQYRLFSFRLLAISSVLIWVVIFNHKAESPTYVIAMSGVSLWYVLSEKNTINNVLFWSAFILTSLSPTELFPSIIRNEIFVPYVLKGVPCILIWFKISYDMLFIKTDYKSIEKQKEVVDIAAT